MRTVLKATLLSAGIALASVSGISAAPVNGGVVKDATAANSPVQQVQHWRWGSGGHWRWGSGGRRWGWGGARRGAHWRWGSRW
jgi:hypothetical protein